MVGIRAHVLVTATLLVTGCGGTPTAPSTGVEPFPPFTDAPFAGGTPPNYAGQWQSGMTLMGCRPAGPGCERAGQSAQLGTTPVRLQLSQSVISLSGQMTITASPAVPMTGTVTANGFIINSGSDVLNRLRAKATRISEDQLTVTLIMETFNGQQVATTSRYEGTFARSAQSLVVTTAMLPPTPRPWSESMRWEILAANLQ